MSGELIVTMFVALSCCILNERWQGPDPRLHNNFMRAVREDQQFPWLVKYDLSNIPQEMRNKALAEAIERGCKDLRRIEVLAKAAQLDRNVILPGDRRPGDKILVYPGKTPLQRARERKDEHIIKILEAVSVLQKHDV